MKVIKGDTRSLDYNSDKKSFTPRKGHHRVLQVSRHDPYTISAKDQRNPSQSPYIPKGPSGPPNFEKLPKLKP